MTPRKTQNFNSSHDVVPFNPSSTLWKLNIVKIAPDAVCLRQFVCGSQLSRLNNSFQLACQDIQYKSGIA